MDFLGGNLQQTDVNIMDFLGGHLKSQMEPEAALKTLNTLRAASSGLSNVNYNNQTIHKQQSDETFISNFFAT